jgi:hypothetical protein
MPVALDKGRAASPSIPLFTSGRPRMCLREGIRAEGKGNALPDVGVDADRGAGTCGNVAVSIRL